MKELVEYIAGAIVSRPEQVQVHVGDDGRRVGISLTVASEDKGRIIGRRGRMANAMRTLVRAMRTGRDVRVDLDIE